MKQLWNKIAAEWEKSLLWGMVILSLVCVAAKTVLLSEGEGELTIKNTIPSIPVYFDRRRLAMAPVPLPEDQRDPFLFQQKISPPKAPAKQQPSTAPKQGQGKKPAGGAKQQQQNAAGNVPQKPAPKQQPAPAKPAPPPKPPHLITIAYRGFLKTAEKQEVAFLTTTDSLSKKTTTTTRAIGETLPGKIKILSATASELTVEFNQKPFTVAVGKKTDIRIE